MTRKPQNSGRHAGMPPHSSLQYSGPRSYVAFFGPSCHDSVTFSLLSREISLTAQPATRFRSGRIRRMKPHCLMDGGDSIPSSPPAVAAAGSNSGLPAFSGRITAGGISPRTGALPPALSPQREGKR